MYKSAFLGCGGRARGHAQAYQHVEGGQIVAICDMNEELLNSFGDDFGVSERYTDLHQMLEQESPDLLHIVTAPTLRGTGQLIRHSLMQVASDHEVPSYCGETNCSSRGRLEAVSGIVSEHQDEILCQHATKFPPAKFGTQR